MKKLLFISVVSLLFLQEVRTQNWFASDYRWVFHITGGFAALDADMEMFAEKDTMIQGHPSRKWIFHSNGYFTFPPRYTYSDGPKAYYFDVASDSFVKIYDFSLPVGAEVHIPKDLGLFKYKIEAIDTVQAGSFTLKRQRVNYLLQNGPSGWHFDILENIGMVGTPFDTLDYSDCAFVFIPDYQCNSVVDGFDIMFRCFSTSTGTFNPLGGSCSVVSTNTPQEEYWTVTPNPATDYVDIQVKNNGPALERVSVSDMAGKTLCSWNNAQTHYSLATLPPGVYLLQATFSNGERAVKKILKI